MMKLKLTIKWWKDQEHSKVLTAMGGEEENLFILNTQNSKQLIRNFNKMI